MSEENLSEVLAVRREKLKKLQEEGKNPFEMTRYDVTAYADDVNENFEAYEEKPVSMAGRIMSKRGQGKVGFYDLQDSTGKIQMFLKKDLLENYDEIKTYDIGDIVGIKGEVFKTQKGQISVRVKELTLLSKSLQILPEKYHGLKDTELRYRQRYVDLIVNPEVKNVFILRSQIIRKIREFLDNRGFIEVETPVLYNLAGGANARPFVTHHNALDIPLYMRIALELPLKRLIVGGFDKVYELSRVFRNEGMDATHNPEFTLLETYEAYADYDDVMNMVEALYGFLAKEILGTDTVEYEGHDISLAAPFKRARMVDLVEEHTGVNFDVMTDLAEAQEAAKKLHVDVEDKHSIGEIIAEVFDEYVEDKLIQPTFVTMHPVEISPLSKREPTDPRYTQRFELFINGAECANAFSELNDPIDQKGRFEAQVQKKADGDDEAHPYDADFINALEVGLPPTGGLGIGIDRLVMLFTGQHSIRDVILFPTMKTLGGVKSENGVSSKEVSTPNSEPEKIDFSKVKIEPIFEEMVDFDTFAKSDFRAVKILACEAVPKSKKLLKFTLDDGERKDRVILSGIHEYYEPEELVGKTAIAIVNLPPRKMMGIDSEGMLISAVHEEDGHEGLNLLMVDDRIPAGAKLY
ncbi:Elongation factor P--(R)-beta-lysine ligase [Eubacterium callanderi]|uniref:lysine--tRNA ligase n=1 Tax=Eubacterium callanderi TaxID=53442 RepID=UPI0029FF0E77|nr:lysine--tRNA ligase [Eubacterium callanderi]WPK69375.1 Elongation factor P--(R)-beta-lysine ligase [Eubacterium callanderi]WPK73673.1 Elongation factor P--(R)-beta-lysine ligase [Eubacterium callanderi]